MGETGPQWLLERLTEAKRRLSVIATGGGSQAISGLCGTPGASRVVLEGLVPYASAAVDRLLGGPQEQYCGDRTARRLAVAAWQRALPMASAEMVVGAAVTASLATVTPKRGGHRIHAAVQTADATHTATLSLTKGARSRTAEEPLAASLLLGLVAAACGVVPAADAFGSLELLPDERIETDLAVASPTMRQLFVGNARLMRAVPPFTAPASGPLPAAESVIFPGSFDPLHEGHRRMATLAAEIAERPVAFELSITNVDKPTLDYVELRERSRPFLPPDTLWLSRAATFLEKVELFPRATFVMGADTFIRLADPRYYGGSKEATAAAVRSIADAVGSLIVFGRAVEGVFQDPSQLDVPQPLRKKAYFVSQREFRADVSSTAIRRKAACGND